MNKVEITGVNTARLETLTEAKKTQLLLEVRQGNLRAREQLVSGNLRLVLSVVQKFSGRSENPDDLFQVGCIGLIKAIDHFDPSFDVRFSTYAVPMIVGEIRRYLRDNNAMRVSRSLRDTAYKALQSREALTSVLHRDPSTEEIARDIGLDEQAVNEALGAIVEPVSLYEPIYSDGGDPICVMDQDRERRHRPGLDRCHVHPGVHRFTQRPGKEDPLAAVSGRADPDRSGRGDRHLSGADQPTGEKRHPEDQGESLIFPLHKKHPAPAVLKQRQGVFNRYQCSGGFSAMAMSSGRTGRVWNATPVAFRIAPRIAGAGVLITSSPMLLAPKGPVGS